MLSIASRSQPGISLMRSLPSASEITVRSVSPEEAPWMSLVGASSQIGAWHWDAATRTLSATDEVFSLLRAEHPSELTTVEDWSALVHPEDVEQVEMQVRRLVNEGQSIDTTFRVGDVGNSSWLQLRGQVVADGGYATKACGVLIEATRRQSLVEKTLNEVTQEQKRIAYELTDELAQQLTGIKMRSEMLLHKNGSGEREGERLTELVQSIKSAQVFARQLSSTVTPIVVSAKDLGAMMDQLASTTSIDHGLECDISISATLDNRCDSVATQLYRVVEDCLAVAVECDGSESVEVHLYQYDQRIVVDVEVHDYFEGEALLHTDAFHDLQVRTALLGAELEVDSIPCGVIRCII